MHEKFKLCFLFILPVWNVHNCTVTTFYLLLPFLGPVKGRDFFLHIPFKLSSKHFLFSPKRLLHPNRTWHYLTNRVEKLVPSCCRVTVLVSRWGTNYINYTHSIHTFISYKPHTIYISFSSAAPFIPKFYPMGKTTENTLKFMCINFYERFIAATCLFFRAGDETLSPFILNTQKRFTIQKSDFPMRFIVRMNSIISVMNLLDAQ